MLIDCVTVNFSIVNVICLFRFLIVFYVFAMLLIVTLCVLTFG